MSFRATVLRRSNLVVFLLGLAAASAAFGQAKDSPIVFVNRDAITTSFVTPPIMTTADASAPPTASDLKQWLKVEFHYQIKPAKGKFQDAVEFKIWMEGRDLFDPRGKQGEGIAVALTGSVTYLFLASGSDLYGVFYVHPSVLARYSTSQGYEDFDRKFNIHLEAYADGKLMDYFDKKKDPQGPDWYKPLTAIGGLVYRQDQSPFLLTDPDRYPMIKLSAAP